MQNIQGSDKVITQQIHRELVDQGVAWPSKVGVESRSGEVTLSGSVQYFHQKKAAVGAAIGVAGVRRVVDEMTIDSRTRWNFLTSSVGSSFDAVTDKERDHRRMPENKTQRVSPDLSPRHGSPVQFDLWGEAT
jgi:hypothetical protein